MPKDVPMANRIECDYYGAHVTFVDGLISDCARKVADLKKESSWEKDGWFDVSTTKEPYRVEGKKTMGYEVAEQLGWRIPQGIIYPTGGGVGLLGMWKAFEEMEALGWIGSERPKMITVQSAGCAPDREGMGRTPAHRRNVAECRDHGLGPARSQALRRLSDSRHSDEEQRHRHQRHRRRNSRGHAALGKSRRHFRRARRRSVAGRLPQSFAPTASSNRKTR